ncbi:MAG TPA: ATP-binding protein [Acidimicrobiia bacterium]|nr:ATP-binding protein [Acidimicrobiia bacterium]
MSTATFEAHRSTPRRARSFVDTVLADARVDATTRETVRLLVSEVVTNAVLHARSAVDVTVRVLASHVRVEVEDGSPAEPVLRHPGPSSATGRGLQFLDRLAFRWGWSGSAIAATPSKCVWFEVARVGAVPASR